MDPDAVDLVIDDLDAVLSQLRAAHAAKVPGKKLRLRWWWE